MISKKDYLSGSGVFLVVRDGIIRDAPSDIRIRFHGMNDMGDQGDVFWI